MSPFKLLNGLIFLFNGVVFLFKMKNSSLNLDLPYVDVVFAVVRGGSLNFILKSVSISAYYYL